MAGDGEILQKFRNPDEKKFNNKFQLGIVDYLIQNVDVEWSKIYDALMARAQEKTDIYQKYRLKRTGRNDENDIIFFYGKIHGIENIIFLDKDTLDAVRGNPAKLQLAINNVQVPSTKAHSYEELMKKHNENLKKWKEYVEKLPIYGSDKKKMLALPFYAAKRT